MIDRGVATKRLALCTCWLALDIRESIGAGKKPLFEYDDHFVMLNDYGRNEYYLKALAAAMPDCPGCTVLDVGAGSGLLSIMAAQVGAKHVIAMEANPDLAKLATMTIARNQASLNEANVTVLPLLSSKIGLELLPAARKADLLVTETFGTMLLGEGALNFVPDVRDRLLKEGGTIIPAGGCQYATLVEVPDLMAAWSPASWDGLNLSHLESLQDTVYWKAMVGASRARHVRLSERICVLEVDLYRSTSDDVPKNRSFRFQANRKGTVHAVLFDWDIWVDRERTQILSTTPGSRNFAGDVAWGWLLQLHETAGDDWQLGDTPSKLTVEAGDWLEMGVEFIARGISMHARVRRSQAPATSSISSSAAYEGTLPSWSSPSRILSMKRQGMKEANDYFLPVAGDAERHDFYAAAVADTVASIQDQHPTRQMSLLDCSANAGLPAFSAANKYGLRSLAMPRWDHIANVLKKVAEDNHVNKTAEVFAADPREMFDILLPGGKRADIVVLDPPGTPLHGLSPFAVLPAVRKELLEADGLVVPSYACLEVGLLESEDLSLMFSVPDGRWKDIDLTVWNEEARNHGVLSHLVPYAKWLGAWSTVERRWLSTPRCIFEVDFNSYARMPPSEPEEILLRRLTVNVDGHAHAVVARWSVWSGRPSLGSSRKLGAESKYAGRDLTWPHYVQALAREGTDPGLLEPVPVEAGQSWQLEMTVRQGAAKVTGSAGPEFSLRLLGTAVGGDGRGASSMQDEL